VWGAAEAYPPESADLALIAGRTEAELYSCDMAPVSRMLDFGAFLIANRSSWGANDLGEMVASICDNALADEKHAPARSVRKTPETAGAYRVTVKDRDVVRLALPDGHQQQPTTALLSKAGIQIDDYPSGTGNRRPRPALEWLTVKLIRPQDMPLQVANGNFDLAITGKDWLAEHRYQFPSSPVKELLDLKYGKVRLVAVVSNELPVSGVADLSRIIAEKLEPFRVASEYVNIADKYARDNHLGRCRVIPTWGATEAFLPEDADLLIENTETGRTIARHNLKIIDNLFESTARLIGYKTDRYSSVKKERIKSIVDKLQKAVEGA
jgi:ATP phosphoribosyltransferase